MRTYKIEIIGESPLLLHRDNIEFADGLKAWRENPKNKERSTPGDDRSPAFTWLGCLYTDAAERFVAMPADNIMRCLMEGGAAVPVPGGKRGKTFKSQTQSGMMLVEESLPILIDGRPVEAGPLLALERETDFDAHKRAAEASGFSLFVKRAKIGTSKHIRVRPRFGRWDLVGHINVWDEQITTAALKEIVSYAGDYKGLGDWRPSSKTPGPFGRFKAEVSAV